MPRRINRNFAFLAVALLFGVAASFLAVRYVHQQVAARTQKAPAEATTRVVVPVRDLPKGATLRADDVAARAVPTDFVPADAITLDDYQDYLGQVLLAPLNHGAPIPATAVESLTNHFSTIIQPDDVAYSIQADETNSVSGLIVPGDHIDIMLLTSGHDNAHLRPLLSNVLVLATGQRARGVQSTAAQQSNSYSTMTLELRPADAQRVSMAKKIGQLRVMLRRPGNNQPFGLKTLTKADLLRLGRGRGSGVQFIIGGSG